MKENAQNPHPHLRFHQQRNYIANYPLANLLYPSEHLRIRRFGGFRGRSLILVVGKRAETKMALPSTRCEARTLGEILSEDGGEIPNKLLMPARILIPGEVKIWDGIQNVRSCLGIYMWVQIQGRDHAFIFSRLLGCIEFGWSGLGVVVSFSL